MPADEAITLAGRVAALEWMLTSLLAECVVHSPAPEPTLQGISDRLRGAAVDLTKVAAGLAHDPVQGLSKTAEADALLELRRRLVMTAGAMRASGEVAN